MSLIMDRTKAVIILLTLFSLGVKDIYLGAKPPQFLNED